MPKGYIILTENIKDPAGMAEYGNVASQAMAGATLLSFDQKPEVLEGSGTAARLFCWNSSRSTRRASGITRRCIRRPPSCARRQPTLTVSSSPACDGRFLARGGTAPGT
ncbi:hypothetical protein ACVWWN_003295 [Mycobacterium sp. URHB0021]|jgi:uncharacterized protein DUF1330